MADHWGKSTAAKAGNLFTAGTVDAAFVDGTHTYLFGGDRYVRYTGDSYQTIDEDYPREIPENDEDIPRWNRVGAAFSLPVPPIPSTIRRTTPRRRMCGSRRAPPRRPGWPGS